MNRRDVFREFSSRREAEILRGLLQAHGISADVVSDDCGAVDPALQFVRGVFLLVGPDDRERAEQVVAEALADPAADESPE